MLKKIFNVIILLPLALIVVALAVANRHVVRLVLDPISPEVPLFALEAPFFMFLFGALLMGVLLGGMGMWFGQRKWRAAAQRRSLEAHEWRREAERLGRELTTHHSEINGAEQNALPAP